MAIRRASLAAAAILPVGGPAGLPGQGTYQAWLTLPGNEGKSLDDFLASLKGADGATQISALKDATDAFLALNAPDTATQRKVLDAAAVPDLLGAMQDVLAAILGLQPGDIGAAPASALATPSSQRFSVADGNATVGQTTIPVSPYTPGALLVFLNGAKLPTNAYTATSGTSVVLSDPIQATDTVEVLSWLMAGVQNAAPISHQHNVSDILGLMSAVTARALIFG